MKTRKKKFKENIYHEIKDEEEVERYLEEILPSVGYVVMYFNSLEKSLGHIICAMLSDKSDDMGLLVLHKMSYSSKVDLFKRLCDNFHSLNEMKIDSYEELIEDLRESGRLRNLVIHADWENTDNENYTYVTLRINKDGMQQEYKQFSEKSLTEIILLIMYTRTNLYKYWDERNEKLFE